jgi:hypothetical protein
VDFGHADSAERAHRHYRATRECDRKRTGHGHVPGQVHRRAPYFIQWRRGNGAGGFTNIPGATCPSYSTAAVIPADNGAVFSVVVSNNLGSVVSSNAVLTVLRDTNGPVLLSAIGNAAGDQVILTFSELLDTATGGEISNYRIVAVGGPDELLLSSVTLTNGTNVIIVNDPSTPRNPGQNYAVNVSSVRDIVGNSIRPDPFVLQIRPDVVLIGSIRTTNGSTTSVRT